MGRTTRTTHPGSGEDHPPGQWGGPPTRAVGSTTHLGRLPGRQLCMDLPLSPAPSMTPRPAPPHGAAHGPAGSPRGSCERNAKRSRGQSGQTSPCCCCCHCQWQPAARGEPLEVAGRVGSLISECLPLFFPEALAPGRQRCWPSCRPRELSETTQDEHSACTNLPGSELLLATGKLFLASPELLP